MEEIRFAKYEDKDEVQGIDYLVMGNLRFKMIEEYIINKKCIIYLLKRKILGFLLFNMDFFQNNFIELLIVSDEARRKGIGSKMLLFYEKTLNPGKIFTSTNQSNEIMQRVLEKNGYKYSGIIYNLDEDDPEVIFCKLK